MYFPNDDIKINRFKPVYIPKNREYMSRLGRVTAPPEAFSGDAEIHRQQNKVDDLEFYARYAAQIASESHDE